MRGKSARPLAFFLFFFEREAFLFISPPFPCSAQSSPAWVYFDHLDGRNDLGLSLPSLSSLVFYSSFWFPSVAVAETISHEVGHMLGLGHDGVSYSPYYRGHTAGGASWAPIMGNAFERDVTQWSRGVRAQIFFFKKKRKKKKKLVRGKAAISPSLLVNFLSYAAMRRT